MFNIEATYDKDRFVAREKLVNRISKLGYQIIDRGNEAEACLIKKDYRLRTLWSESKEIKN